ncbi:MAG: saccharopine dehydrogenase family protein [Ktedonobacterales bacterium]
MAEWMLYGANGYTGALIAREATKRGMPPVLAGRNAQVVNQLGKELGCATRSFSLTDPEAIVQHLHGVRLVLLCAGPFSATSQPMLEACKRAATHYLDITGEIPVLESLFRQAPSLAQAGIVALPGVGFDVVPTDCLAAMLKRELPDATSLRLVFASEQGLVSRGTMLTSLESVGEPTKMRKDGKIIDVAGVSVMLPFGDRPAPALRLSWGDVSTAYYSTGIPTIETFIGTPALVKRLQQITRWERVLAWGPMRSVAKGFYGRTLTGPTEAQRAQDDTIVWGEVSNRAGRKVAMKLRTPAAYSLTVDAAVTAVARMLDGNLEPGAYTPSLAFGPEFVLGLRGVEGPLVASASASDA